MAAPSSDAFLKADVRTIRLPDDTVVAFLSAEIAYDGSGIVFSTSNGSSQTYATTDLPTQARIMDAVNRAIKDDLDFVDVPSLDAATLTAISPDSVSGNVDYGTTCVYITGANFRRDGIVTINGKPLLAQTMASRGLIYGFPPMMGIDDIPAGGAVDVSYTDSVTTTPVILTAAFTYDYT